VALQCKPGPLIASAKCLECFTPNQLREILSYLQCQWALTKQVATFNIFTTPQVLANGSLTVAHHLNQVPPIVIPVLVCISNDVATGYQVGDEIQIPSASSSNTGIVEGPCSVFWDATNIYLHSGFLSAGNQALVKMYRRGASGVNGISSVNNFALKAYAIVPTNGQSFTAPDQSNNTGAGSFGHGMNGVPNLIFPAYHCTANDANTAATIGVEENVTSCFQNAGAKGVTSAVRANSSNLITDTAMFFAGNEANFDSWVVSAFNVTNPSSLNNFVLRPRCFLVAPSFTQTLAVGSGAFSFTHGFSKTPQLIYTSIACIANDAASGFTAGDEIPIWQVSTSAFLGIVSGISANSTNIIGNTANFAAGQEATTNIWQTKVSNIQPTSLNNFALKIYAWAI
jgi:hypothetical protein